MRLLRREPARIVVRGPRRHVLRASRVRPGVQQKLAALHAVPGDGLPTVEIDEMLAQIERGYLEV